MFSYQQQQSCRQGDNCRNLIIPHEHVKTDACLAVVSEVREQSGFLERGRSKFLTIYAVPRTTAYCRGRHFMKEENLPDRFGQDRKRGTREEVADDD